MRSLLVHRVRAGDLLLPLETPAKFRNWLVAEVIDGGKDRFFHIASDAGPRKKDACLFTSLLRNGFHLSQFFHLIAGSTVSEH